MFSMKERAKWDAWKAVEGNPLHTELLLVCLELTCDCFGCQGNQRTKP